MKFDIFISYRRQGGSSYARLIKNDLEKQGFRVYLDMDEQNGLDYREEVLARISETPNFLLLLTKECIDRCWEEGDMVLEEIINALRHGKKIIPVATEDFEYPKHWPKEIEKVRFIDNVIYYERVPRTTIEIIVSRLNLGRDAVESDTAISLSTGVGKPAAAEAPSQGHEAAEEQIEIEPSEEASQNFEVGEIYYLGVGVRKDLKTAFNWYRKAALGGSEEAIRRMITMYYSGEGVEKSLVMSYKWTLKAVELGLACGYNALGCCYRDGDCVERNIHTALEYFDKAVELGYPIARSNAAYIYLTGQDGIDVDYRKALSYVEKSPEVNDFYGVFLLGYIYCNGFGVAKDREKAEYYYRMSADGNDSVGQYHYAELLLESDSEADHREAVQWLRKSALYGSFDWARYRLGQLYREGKVVPKNAAEAFKWMKSAVENSSIDEAWVALGQMYEHGEGCTKDYEQALAAYQKAVQLNSGNNGAYDSFVALVSGIIADEYADSRFPKSRLKELELIKTNGKTVYDIAAALRKKGSPMTERWIEAAVEMGYEGAKQALADYWEETDLLGHLPSICRIYNETKRTKVLVRLRNRVEKELKDSSSYRERMLYARVYAASLAEPVWENKAFGREEPKTMSEYEVVTDAEMSVLRAKAETWSDEEFRRNLPKSYRHLVDVYLETFMPRLKSYFAKHSIVIEEDIVLKPEYFYPFLGADVIKIISKSLEQPWFMIKFDLYSDLKDLEFGDRNELQEVAGRCTDEELKTLLTAIVELSIELETVSLNYLDIAQLLGKAGKEDVESQYRLYKAYLSGNILPQDDERADYWFKKAQKNGFTESVAEIAAISSSENLSILRGEEKRENPANKSETGEVTLKQESASAAETMAEHLASATSGTPAASAVPEPEEEAVPPGPQSAESGPSTSPSTGAASSGPAEQGDSDAAAIHKKEEDEINALLSNWSFGKEDEKKE